MSRLEEAEQKLKFADYLISRENTNEFLSGAMKHIFEAANLTVAEKLAFDNKSSISPILVRKKLAEGSEQEQEFSFYFLELWKLAVKPQLEKQEVANAYKRVKLFLNYVKEERS